jgi:hypothetical protein
MARHRPGIRRQAIHKSLRLGIPRRAIRRLRLLDIRQWVTRHNRAIRRLDIRANRDIRPSRDIRHLDIRPNRDIRRLDIRASLAIRRLGILGPIDRRRPKPFRRCHLRVLFGGGGLRSAVERRRWVVQKLIVAVVKSGFSGLRRPVVSEQINRLTVDDREGCGFSENASKF